MNSTKLVSLAVLGLLLLASGHCLEVNVVGDLATPRTQTSALFDGVDSVYILGGVGPLIDGSPRLDEVVKYNVSDHTQAILARFPTGVSNGASAVDSAGNLFYFGGGYELANGTTTYDAAIYKLSPDTYVPEAVGELLSPRAAMTAATIGDSIYIFGGEEEDLTLSAEIIQFNTIDNSFSVIGNLPNPLTRASAVARDTSIYIFCGETSDTSISYSRSIIHFDATTNDVTELDTQLFEAVESAVVVDTGDAFYIIGGYIGGDYPNQRVTAFTPEPEGVEEICVQDVNAILPQRASGIYSEAHNEIFIFGGTTNTTESAVLSLPVDQLIPETCPPTDDDNSASSFHNILFLLFASTFALHYLAL